PRPPERSDTARRGCPFRRPRAAAAPHAVLRNAKPYNRRVKIVIAGGTGFIGEPLVRRLVTRGEDVTVLTRNPAKVTAGRGVQWMSWVDREDVLRLIEWAIDNASARGVYNATAPQPLRNRDLSRALGRALHRPAIFAAPAFGLRLMFGQMADEALLAGQR